MRNRWLAAIHGKPSANIKSKTYHDDTDTLQPKMQTSFKSAQHGIELPQKGS